MDKKLLDILVCPACKGPLVYDKKQIRTGLQGRPPGLSRA